MTTEAHSELQNLLEPQEGSEDYQSSLRITMWLLIHPWKFQYYIVHSWPSRDRENPSAYAQGPEFTQEYESTMKIPWDKSGS